MHFLRKNAHNLARYAPALALIRPFLALASVSYPSFSDFFLVKRDKHVMVWRVMNRSVKSSRNNAPGLWSDPAPAVTRNPDGQKARRVEKRGKK